ncbi:MAG: HPr family phosphocarrier protein [Defluviitaleaceae bacterium]|nr:HPr family phosphocarrier protein [Defluviitaleaceae bacterium]
MIERTVKVNAKIEARPAALFVQTASRFQSSIFIKVDNKMINAKSIMGMIAIGLLDGNQVTIMADGQDEEAAIAELGRFFSTV